MKGIDKKLDDAWSKLVKLRAGMKCEYCHNPNTLNSHHIYGRTNRATRWDERNGVCLCVTHHVFNTKFSAHGTPVDFVKWLEKKRGLNFIASLCVRAHSVVKHTKADKELILAYLTKEIELQSLNNKLKF